MSGMLAVTLLILCAFCIASCTGEMIDDPMWGTSGGGFATGDTAVTKQNAPSSGSDESTEGDVGELTVVGGISLETVAQTDPSMQLGPQSPEEVYANDANVLRADFLNTGKSDAIIIRMDGKVVLIDTGDSNDFALISSRLESYGITAIDVMIISHFDNDHVGSASRIILTYNVGTVYAPDYVRSSANYRNFINAISADGCNTELVNVKEDVRLDLGYGDIWINPTELYPGGQTLGSDDADEFTEENNYSLITTVSFGNTAMLFTGDAEDDRMKEFNTILESEAANGNDIKYTLVKMPHHGSYTNGLGATLDGERPRYCVVCVDDAQNVEPSTVTKMRVIGAGAYYTYNGDIYFITNGTGSVIMQK